MLSTVFARSTPLVDRFWSKVDTSGECWMWTARSQVEGYGFYSVGGKTIRQLAHRYAYELLVGPIPAGMTVDHLCRNRLCVNPRHMELVTRGENTRRGIIANSPRPRVTHCRRGHEFTPANTYLRTGWQHCRTCRRESMRERRARKAA